MSESNGNTVYAFSAELLDGRTAALADYAGKVLLIVNTASKCGFTPQYAGLEELYRRYKDRGLVVLGFPCNQFGAQEPGSAEEIGKFCERNYGVSFPIFAKIDVNGSNAHPLFK
ncbi:MAG TPA: glutathione peroxidase, partial [Acidobacteriaceae bacterium]